MDTVSFPPISRWLSKGAGTAWRLALIFSAIYHDHVLDKNPDFKYIFLKIHICNRTFQGQCHTKPSYDPCAKVSLNFRWLDKNKISEARLSCLYFTCFATVAIIFLYIRKKICWKHFKFKHTTFTVNSVIKDWINSSTKYFHKTQQFHKTISTPC